MARLPYQWPVAVVLVVTVACSSQAAPPPPPAEPIAIVTPTPVPELAPSPTPTATQPPPAIAPPTPSTADPSVSPEELREMLATVRFPPSEWQRTNLAIHSVPLDSFIGQGPRKDGIPPIDSPMFVPVEQADTWLWKTEPVQVVSINGDIRAYPLQILIWHEVVNDVVGGEPVAVTY